MRAQTASHISHRLGGCYPVVVELVCLLRPGDHGTLQRGDAVAPAVLGLPKPVCSRNIALEPLLQFRATFLNIPHSGFRAAQLRPLSPRHPESPDRVERHIVLKSSAPPPTLPSPLGRLQQDGIRCRPVSQVVRMRYLEAVVKPAILGGLMACDRTASHLNAMRHVHNTMIRRALGIYQGEQLTWDQYHDWWRERMARACAMAMQEPWDISLARMY